MIGPKLTTPKMADLWEAAVELKEFSAREAADRANVAISTARHLVRCWVRDGFLVGDGAESHQRFTVAGKSRPAFGPADNRMWQTARFMKNFTVRDIALHSSVEGGVVEEKDASSFVKMLLAGDYLHVVQKAKPGTNPARYRLKRDTGPKPPIRRRYTITIDQNNGEVTLPEELRR